MSDVEDTAMVEAEASVLDSTPPADSNINGHAPEATVDPSAIMPEETSHEPVTEMTYMPTLSPTPSPGPEESMPLPLSSLSQDHSASSDSTIGSPASSKSTVSPASSQSGSFEVVLRKPLVQALPYSSSRTGLVYDARMRFHTELDSPDSKNDVHPEDPRRIWAIFNAFEKAGIVETVQSGTSAMLPFRLLRIPTRLATNEELALAHAVDHIHWVEQLPVLSEIELIKLQKTKDSIYLHHLTTLCAKLSAGGAIEACRAVVSGHARNAFAIIRPPGHHAEHGDPSGFCFFNNVCVAAKVVQRDFPEKCRKILILDWDVHHGNGVQKIFEADPNVLYISLHVHRDGKFYPQGPEGDHLHCGIGDGIGKNVNIPWPAHHMRDGDYLYAFQQVVMPIAQEFNPDFVIISAGFDAADGDELGQCHVTPEGFAHMTHMLMSLANGKVVACLEGGYNLSAIANSALAVTRTLMGEPPGRVIETEPSTQGVATVQLVLQEQSRYWKHLHPTLAPSARLRKRGERLHDVLRARQAHEWFSKFCMSPLFVLRDSLSRCAEYQVLATNDYMDEKPLLLILHDPSETMPLEGSTYGGSPTTDTFMLADVTEPYIAWAIQQSFAVIDVNINTPPPDSEALTNRPYPDNGLEGDATGPTSSNELTSYIWENYVEPYDATHVFILGIGHACRTVTWFLSNQPGERLASRIRLVANFVADATLTAVARPADDAFSAWFYANSLVFVADSHAVWHPDRKRPRKKYGRLLQSHSASLVDMLPLHQAQLSARLLDLTAAWRADHGVPGVPMAGGAAAAAAAVGGLHAIDAALVDGDGDDVLRHGHGAAAAGAGSQDHVMMDGELGAGASSPQTSPSRIPPMGVFSVTREGRANA